MIASLASDGPTELTERSLSSYLVAGVRPRVTSYSQPPVHAGHVAASDDTMTCSNASADERPCGVSVSR